MDASDATAGWTRTRHRSQLLAIEHADGHRLFSVSPNCFISFREESGETVKKGSATHQSDRTTATRPLTWSLNEPTHRQCGSRNSDPGDIRLVRTARLLHPDCHPGRNRRVGILPDGRKQRTQPRYLGGHHMVRRACSYRPRSRGRYGLPGPWTRPCRHHRHCRPFLAGQALSGCSASLSPTPSSYRSW